MLKPLTQEGVDATQEWFRDKFSSDLGHTQANVDAIIALEATSELRYEGRRYRVPPVPYRAGIILQKRYMELQEIIGGAETEDSLRKLLTLCEQLLPLFKTLCVPVSTWERLTWRWRDPFANASQQDLGRLLGFFCACRMKSSVDFNALRPQESDKQSTQWMTSPSSSAFSLHGAKTGILDPGGTSFMA